MSEWRPIETAPKDGTEFLSIYGLDDDGTYWIIYWNGAFFECVSSGHEISHATHWMPLPAAPNTASGSD